MSRIRDARCEGVDERSSIINLADIFLFRNVPLFTNSNNRLE